MGGKEKWVGQLLCLFRAAGKLKEVKRQGWVERGVSEGESVAGHSFRLAFMAMVLAERQGLDACKAVKLALVHDLPEAECGDIVSRAREEMQEVSNAEKRKREERALEKVLGKVGRENAKRLRALWTEFEKGESREARLVRELDRLEAILQAREYEEKGNFKVSLQEFYDYGDSRIKGREIRRLFEQILSEKG